MRKAVCIILCAVMLTCAAFAAELYVDTLKISTDVPPVIIDGRTFVPFRALFEALGATVEWEQETKTATALRGDTTIKMIIGSKTAYVNGEEYVLDVPPQIVESRTMVPVRFIGESLSCEVTWYAKTKTAAVADKMKGQKIYVTQTGKRYHYDSSCNGGTYYEATLSEAMGRGLTPCNKCVLK
ncbi:MAG: copper amine oxidase N-terminal domain-containing protein [Clostridia bacterium]|nr:copper amine oxidase N-terminal domain-containing protein [Clostridia bacterium]